MRETKNQIDDLMNEIRARTEAGERTLVTTLTKKMSEDLTDYLMEYGVRVRYLHSEVDTLERIQIIRELRLGEYDVLVGVNLLREGLDLPGGVAGGDPRRRQGGLPARRDLADPDDRPRRPQHPRQGDHVRRQGDGRHAHGASRETDRRRAIQVAYNEEHGITPETIQKGVSDIADFLAIESKVPRGRGRRRQRPRRACRRRRSARTMVELEEEMLAAADDLRFEYAAKLRDEIKALRRELDEIEAGA